MKNALSELAPALAVSSLHPLNKMGLFAFLLFILFLILETSEESYRFILSRIGLLLPMFFFLVNVLILVFVFLFFFFFAFDFSIGQARFNCSS